MVTCQNVIAGIGAFLLDGVDLGGTDGGINVEKSIEIFEKEVDQLLDACGIVPTKYTVTVTTNLAEATLANLKIAWNEPSAITNPAPNQLRLGIGLQQTIPEHELVFTGPSPSGLGRTVRFWRALQVEASAWSFQKGEKVMYPVAFRCLPDRDNHSDDDIYGEIIDEITP